MFSLFKYAPHKSTVGIALTAAAAMALVINSDETKLSFLINCISALVPEHPKYCEHTTTKSTLVIKGDAQPEASTENTSPSYLDFFMELALNYHDDSDPAKKETVNIYNL